jgi:catechol 2,3-dioxygenase-like lactoylglutathione lyase family enzyme
MKVTEGLNWVINCATDFQQTVAFFRDVMGLEVTAEGVPVTDIQFTRLAQITLSTGVLEIVEPTPEVQQLYAGPVRFLQPTTKATWHPPCAEWEASQMLCH